MNLLVGNTRRQARDAWIYLCADTHAKPGESLAWMYTEIGGALMGHRFDVVVILPWTRPADYSDVAYETRQQWIGELLLKVTHPTDVVYL